MMALLFFWGLFVMDIVDVSIPNDALYQLYTVIHQYRKFLL